MDALVRQSVQDVVNDAQRTANRGGHMRVDTGFLRASGQLSLTGMPSGPVRGEKRAAGTEGETYEWESSAVELTLRGVQAGGRVYFGWTAVYAKYREAYDGFLFSAVQNWQAIVDRAARRIWWNSPQGGRRDT